MAQGPTAIISRWNWVFIAQNRIHFITRKKRVFPGFFSQLPETRVLKFCPEFETLIFTTFLWTKHWSKSRTKIRQIFRPNISKIVKKSVTRQSKFYLPTKSKNSQIWRKNSTSGNTARVVQNWKHEGPFHVWGKICGPQTEELRCS